MNGSVRWRDFENFIQEPMRECKYFFWGGCQGNKNNFEKVEECESTCGIAKARDSIPTTPASTTPGQRLPFRTTQGIRITPGNLSRNEDNSVPERLYFKICDVFTYTGCQGNGNNYASREECMAICHKESAPVVVSDFANVCKHDVDAGECNGVFQRFAFDTESGECRPFTYGGCGGNGNNFATLAECRIKCQKVALSAGNLCEHDIEVGECSGVFVRFGYDKSTNDCRQFTYGGCGGNGNNFATIQECRNVCIKKVCNANPQCDLTRCQIVNDRNGCPFCSCPPTSQPSPPGMLQDCVCPSLPGSIVQPPASFDEQDVSPMAPPTPRPTNPTARVMQASVRPPSAPVNVGPPSGPTVGRASPPGTITGQIPRRQDSNQRPSLVTTTYYPETYEAWGIDLNRHPELGSASASFPSSPSTTTQWPAPRPRQKPAVVHREEITPRSVDEATTHRTTTKQQQNMEERRRSTSAPPPITNIVHREQNPSGSVAETTTRFTRMRQQQTPEEGGLSSTRPIPNQRQTTDSIAKSATRPPRTSHHQTFEKHSSATAPSVITFAPRDHSQREARTETTTRFVTTRPQQISEEHFTPNAPRFSRVLSQGQQPLPERSRHVFEDSSKAQPILVKPLEPLRESIQPRADTVPPTRPQPTTSAPEVTDREHQINVVLRENQPSVELPPPEILDRSQLPRQQSVATHPHVYRTNSIGNYNPQQNNNLAGLSPPVDPTYFTYNSQHLGGTGHRQFAVNNVPFNRQLPPTRANWNQSPFPGLEARAMAPQTFSALRPDQQFQIVHPNQFNQPQLNRPHLSIRKPSADVVNGAGLQQFAGPTNIPETGIPHQEMGVSPSLGAQNRQVEASPPDRTSFSSQPHVATQSDTNLVRKMSIDLPFEPHRGRAPEPRTGLSANSQGAGPSPPLMQPTISSFADEQSRPSSAMQSSKFSGVPQEIPHRFRNTPPFMLMVQNEVGPSQRIRTEQNNGNFVPSRAGQPPERVQTPPSPQNPEQSVNSRVEQPSKDNRSWTEQRQPVDPNRSSHNVPINKQAEIKNVQKQFAPTQSTIEDRVTRTDGPPRNEFPRRTIENNRMVVSSRPNQASPVEQGIMETK
ncbi:Kunitz/Bovine pancreatic trypsin inhibitor domain protein, partial [Teladorsagia circumcincta]